MKIRNEIGKTGMVTEAKVFEYIYKLAGSKDTVLKGDFSKERCIMNGKVLKGKFSMLFQDKNEADKFNRLELPYVWG